MESLLAIAPVTSSTTSISQPGFLLLHTAALPADPHSEIPVCAVLFNELSQRQSAQSFSGASPRDLRLHAAAGKHVEPVKEINRFWATRSRRMWIDKSHLHKPQHLKFIGCWAITLGM